MSRPEGQGAGTAPRQTGIADPLLGPLSELVAQQLGLHFPPNRWQDLERGARQAARESGAPDIQSYVNQLLSTPLSTEHAESLARNLTIGETYFFRDPGSFAALTADILPELIDKRSRGERHLRIWSAGCSTGEEPYSVAILLDRHFPDILHDWQVTLLGTDINPRVLECARKGVFREWSFRDAPVWLKRDYFRPLGRDRLEIVPRIKERVTFACLNLARDIYPSLLSGTHTMDLVLCRNVLMYLTPTQAQVVIQRLGQSLVAGGWLLVSPVEVTHITSPELTVVRFPQACAHQKLTNRASPAVAADTTSNSPRQSPAGDSLECPPSATEVLRASVQHDRRAPPDLSTPTADEMARQASAHAGEGRLDEALACCREAIRLDKLNPHWLFLFASICDEMGRTQEAIDALRRALYLEPRQVLAHFMLGNLLRQRGEREQSSRCARNALRLLSGLPGDEVLPESGGLTVQRLTEIIGSTFACPAEGEIP